MTSEQFKPDHTLASCSGVIAVLSAFLIVVAFPVVLNAAPEQHSGPRWMPVAESEQANEARALVVGSSDAGVEVAVNVPGVALLLVSAPDGNRYSQLSVSGCGVTADEVGLPEMPFMGFFLEIPYGVDVSVEVLDEGVVSLGTGYRVYPLQPPQPDSGDERPAFAINEPAYATDAFFPAEPVVINEPAFIRGRRVAFVQAFPLRYNPATTELQAFSDLCFELVFTGEVDPTGAARRARLATPESEALAEALILNHEPADIPRSGTGRAASRSNGAHYLIIVDDDLYEEIQPLADWKAQKGLVTKVVKTSEISLPMWLPWALKNYIQDAYDNWDPAPSYVLLVGDSQDIPGKWITVGPYEVYTDIDYACVDGADYFPDLAIGRLPVHAETDCTNVVNKILAYDRFPAPDDDWYDDFLSAGYFQDNLEDDDGNPSTPEVRDGVADRWFMETSAHVTEFLSHTMITHTAWWTNSDWTGTFYYRSDGYPHRFPPPVPVPAWVTNNWFASEASATSAITTAINYGVGHVLHRDHGSITGWSHPAYDTSHIAALANGNKTPVVFSINCQTGSFHAASGDCFCEAFLKKNPGGCVGAVGATRISFSGHNDLLVHGLYTSFFPIFNMVPVPTPPGYAYDSAFGSISHPRSRRLGRALNYAKYYMLFWEGPSDLTDAEFLMFHWFGDPEMGLRFNNPSLLTVTVMAQSLAVPGGLGTMRVNVDLGRTREGEGPVASALVAISHELTDELWTGVTDASGSVTFEEMEFTEPFGYTLVVTAPDCVPYEDSLDIDGACCDDETGDCQDYVQMLQCAGRWTSVLCAEMVAPCGTGACCDDVEFCEYTDEDACEASDGLWLGYGSSCDDCCTLSCPPDASMEGEPCGWDTNGGCEMADPAFEPISCEETICGSLWATAAIWDADWYELLMTDAGHIVVTLEGAECPALIGILEQEEWGVPGCDNLTGELRWSTTTAPCVETSVTSACLLPGTYYLYVAPAVEDGYPCDAEGRGNDYVMTVECEVCEVELGVCCDDVTASCDEDVYELNCRGAGLRFLAGGTCADLDPPCGSLGVCCDDENGTCRDDAQAAYCQGYGQRFLAAPATCDDFDPPCGTPWGVCCGPDPGDCVSDVFEPECQGQGQYFLAAPASCDDCETAVTGVCCSDYLGVCEEGVYEFNCRGSGLRFLPDPATCADFDPPCGPAWGACCDDDSGVCVDGIYESQCTGFGTRFVPAARCDELDPPCGIAACCLPDDTCEMLSPGECADSPYNGVPQEPGSVCTLPWACCFEDGSCVEVDPLCCDDMGGSVGFVDHCMGDGNGNGTDDACELLGDFDGDGDIDLEDYSTFAGCIGGPGVTSPPPPCDPVDFERADLDGDIDVDLRDFGVFQELFTGSLMALTFYSTDDTFIDMYYPDNNYGALSYMVVRNRDGGGSSIWEYDALASFDLSSIPPGASITSATLYLYYYAWSDNDPAGRELTCHRLTGDWDEATITWNTQPSRDEVVTDGSIVPSAPGVWMTWDVTGDVQAFIDGLETNYGWIIMDEEPWGQGGIPYAAFHTKENGDFVPYLLVE